MAEDNGDKTEDPSGKRLNDAREKGQIARSKELTLFAMLVGSACLIKAYGPAIGQGLLKIMENSFQLNRELIFDPAAPVNALKQAALDAALMLAPFAAILVALALIVPVVLGGWVFSWSALEPKFDRLDPIKGVGRLVSSEGWINLLKSLGSIALIGIVSVVLIRRYLNDLIALDDLPVTQSIENTAAIIEQCYLLLSLSLILVVAIDVPYQLWHYKDQLKMTRQEVKDENKQTEGSPEIKSRVRRAQHEISQRRMMSDVPKADVIVTNPTHFAVALQYDQNAGGAPKVIAKGVDLIAAQIRQVAAEARVPLVAAPPLARALYYATEIDQQIPQGLYVAVAQVLAYVFQLKTARLNHWDEPSPPSDIKVPEEFKQG